MGSFNEYWLKSQGLIWFFFCFVLFVLDCQSVKLGVRDAGIDGVGILGMIMNTMALTRVIILWLWYAKGL